jgi:hypothetical protein
MKPDPTIGDLFDALRSVPRRVLDVRLSTIAQLVLVVVFVAAYVGFVLLLGKILSYWWHPPSYFYWIAFVLAPLRYWISAQGSKAEKIAAIVLVLAAVASYEYYVYIQERSAAAEIKRNQEQLENEKMHNEFLKLLQEQQDKKR